MRHGKAEQCGEDDHEDDHQQQRIEHRPQEADDRPFVSNRKIAIHEVVEKVGVPDDVLALLAERREVIRGVTPDLPLRRRSNFKSLSSH